ncbi:AMP-binding protein, partial [Actinomadura adrarensis]
SGATYVPLDPELPDGRLGFMLDDTAPVVVLTDAASRDRIPEGPWEVVRADDLSAWGDLPEHDPSWPIPEGQSSHLLYTSGSTGRPKAVACAADGSIADIFWMQGRYPYEPGDTAIFKTSYGFDVSLWEICWPLYVGARLVVCRPGGHRDVRYLAETIERYQVSLVYIIPTQLKVFLEELPEGGCASLRWMISGGEPVTAALRDTCHRRLRAT